MTPNRPCKHGWQVGLLDIDICGPSIPKMLGLEGEEIHQSNAGWSPVYVEDNLGVMSVGMSCVLNTFGNCHSHWRASCVTNLRSSILPDKLQIESYAICMTHL